MSKRLKPCPFCGSPSVTIQARHPSILPYFAECSTCDARGARREDREAAIAAWNTRPFEDKLRQHDDDGMYLDGHEDGYFEGYQAAGNAWREDVDALRERIDALEWLREVEKTNRGMDEWHPDWKKRSKEANRRRSDARDAMRRMWWNAHEAVES